MNIYSITPSTKYKDFQIYLICLAISFLFLTICSNNSFLYSFNDNQDVNWYITMGNGILNGKIPYKDLFDHKGPIVYLTFAFLCLFNNPYRAVFVLEIFCISLFLFFSYKLASRLYTKTTCIITIILVAFATLTSQYFVVGGGPVEEYCLPILSYMLLVYLDFTHDKNSFSKRRKIIFSILIGILLYIKFTLLLLPAIIFILMSIQLIKSKQWLNLLNIIIMFVAGVLIVTTPLIIYFLANNALYELFYYYFYVNLFSYSSKINIFSALYLICIQGIIPFALSLIGVIVYQKKYRPNHDKYSYLTLFCTYFILLAITGNFSYYFLPLCIFIPIGAGGANYLLQKFPNSIRRTSIIITIIIGLLTPIFANGTLELNDKKSDYIHFQIASDIHSINNDPTLFCYKMWDYGFYNVLGVTPESKFFANSLFEEEDFPEMYNDFRNSISTKKSQFLLVEETTFYAEVNFITTYYDYYRAYSYKYYKDNYRSFDMKVILLIAKQ